MPFQDCVAIVSGGASGLGEACVHSLVDNGAKVSIFDLDEQRAAKIKSELGDAVLFCNTDVTSDKSVQSAIEKTVKFFGGIHIAISCAGIGGSTKVISDEKTKFLEHFNRVLQVNLVGTINVIRFAAEKMLMNDPNEDSERGVIINTSSISAFEGRIGQAAYSASKAGVVGMTRPISHELAGYGIRVVTISPGLFDTPMWARVPEKARKSISEQLRFPARDGKPGEFAMLVKQIIENPMLNGCNIRLDAALRLVPE